MTMSASNRRDFLRHGLLTGMGLCSCDLTALFRPRSWLGLGTLPARPGARAQSVIHFHLAGGMSHLDTFDPKPEAPGEVRGPLNIVKSKLDGEPLTEALRQTVGIADKITIVRSMTHTEADHDRGT